MIVGIEGVWEWEGFDGGELTLNDRDAYPYFELESIPGLNRGGDFDPEADAATQRTGEVPREDERAGKTLPLEGTVFAESMAELRQACSEFSAALYETAEGIWTVSPHPDYDVYLGDLPTRTFRGRILEAVIDDAQTVGPNRASMGYERPFTIAVRLSDPRYYHPDLTTDTDDTLVEIGGIPWPLVPGTSLDASDTDGVELETTNLGTAPVDALVTIGGPCRNPVIKNQTSGHFLRFRDITIDDGDTLEIDFRTRTIRRGSGANNRKKLDPSSTWFDRGVPCLRPGVNDLRLRAHSISEGASLTVSYHPADAA